MPSDERPRSRPGAQRESSHGAAGESPLDAPVTAAARGKPGPGRPLGEIEERPVPVPFQEGVQVVAKPGLCPLTVTHLMFYEGPNEDEPTGPPAALMGGQTGLSASDLPGEHLLFLALEGLDSLS